MDFKNLKEKALQLKEKALDMTDKALEKGAQRLSESSLVIKTPKELEEFIKKSQTKEFVSKETGEYKTFIKKVIVIFCESGSEFYEDLLIGLPVLATKAFSQNIPLKLCNLPISELKKYKVKASPSLVVFETEKVIKIVEGEEKINTIVKGFSLDIESSIQNIS